ncbi:hypothetical protein QYM42_08770 [Lactococcus lactis]|uniref:hypothetical protein n=1 Tax=Lactococcus lactis TaxID=1358 RepID=UPI00265A0FA3|nr:hypothetical protein [Lactococcus lactis]WKF72469.1 hypothetical protein QYM42_08770 [Lactococcus lactis]
MHYREIINETGIEVIWMPSEYFERGTYLPICSEFPNGGIAIRLNQTEDEIEFTFLHECGHILDGRILRKLSPPQLHIVNEGKANQFLIHNKVSEWVDSHEGLQEYCTAERLCNYLSLNYNEYGGYAEREILNYLNH